MPIKKKDPQSVLDSRHLKVIAAKKEMLKDSLVFVWLDEDRYGHLDKAQLKNLVLSIDQIEPDAVYFPMLKKMRLEFYDKSEFKNRRVLVTVKYEDAGEVDTDEVENRIRQAIPGVKSMDFIHENVDFEVEL